MPYQAFLDRRRSKRQGWPNGSSNKINIINQMKVIAMIPARYGATRFPGKLMADLGGKPVIVRTYMATRATELFDEVYVVTDSTVIRDVVEKEGGKAIMSIKEHECGSDRIAEAVENLDVDIVVNVQGDEPFVKKEPLKAVIDVFNAQDASEIDLASLMQEITDWKDITDPNYVKVIVDKKSQANQSAVCRHFHP